MRGLPKLIATDLDGTIVREDGTTSARTRAAFDRVAAYGIPIVGVTGRGPRLLDVSRHDLPGATYFVLAQGAAVLDLSTPDEPRTLLFESMEAALVVDVIATVEAAVGPLSVLVEPVEAADAFLWGEVHPAWRFANEVHPCSREDALSGRLFKAFAHSDTLSADELLAAARRLVGPEIVELTQAGLEYLEICPRGVTKAGGLAVVALDAGVDPSDILVFGDMPNDLSMFAYAGWGRVAVASAHPEVLAVADEITESCEDDGVAIYLEKLFS